MRKQWVQSKTPLKRLDLALPALADTAGTARACATRGAGWWTVQAQVELG